MAFNGKSDLTLPTFARYVDDFRFWVNAAGRAHLVPEKEIAKMFVKKKKSTQEVVRRCKNPLTSQEPNYPLIATFWRLQIVSKRQM